MQNLLKRKGYNRSRPGSGSRKCKDDFFQKWTQKFSKRVSAEVMLA